MSLYKILRPLIFKLDSEKAHNLAIAFLKYFPNLANCMSARKSYKSLKQQVCGLDFKNPVGLAAGFDKNGETIKAMNGFGFGFVEVGTVTPKGQPGNEKPRMFRVEKSRAVINRLGFNNLGSDNLAKNIARFKFAKSHNKNSGKIICGINIGKNKDTQEALDDYLPLLERFYEKASYITVNISSPNTKNLRDLQDQDNLKTFLSQIIAKRNSLQQQHQVVTPVFLKVAPDLSYEQQQDIAHIVMTQGVDGLIISNTTISRPEGIGAEFKKQQGGLSGKPLFEISNEVLSNFYQLTKAQLPIIAVGGVSNAQDAYHKIKLGASLVQIYSALIYEGFSLVENINKDLDQLLKRDGFESIDQAIGSHYQ